MAAQSHETQYGSAMIVSPRNHGVIAGLLAISSDILSPADSGRVILVRGDILDGALLRRILQENAVDTVLHFAAQTHVDNSFGNSIAFTLNNTLGTHVLLEACRETGGIRRFINVSTDEVYGDSSADSDVGMKETSTLEPTNPYSGAHGLVTLHL